MTDRIEDKKADAPSCELEAPTNGYVHGATSIPFDNPHCTTGKDEPYPPNLDGVGTLTHGARTLLNPNAIPRELWNGRWFVCWKYVDRGKSKPDKVPINPRKPKSNAGATWSNTWADFPTTVECYKANPDLSGIGYVLTERDPYTMIDMDNCVHNGLLNDFAQNIVDRLGTYTEYSPSGRGLRLLVRDDAQPPALKRPEVEVYSTQRFATLTGNTLHNAPIARADLRWLYNQFAPTQSTANSDPHSSSCAERVAPSGDDAALWDYIFKVNPMAEPIYNGDLFNVRGGDQSRAVLLLLNSLALWTKGDAGRMARMIRQTHLDQTKFEAKRGGRTWLDVQIQDAISYMAGRGAK